MRRAVLLAALALVSALAVVGLGAPERAQAARLCPKIYVPVCAVDVAGVRKTYDNACFARAAHTRILAPGRCLGPVCPFIYEPVCAVNPFTNRPETYANLCIAETNNATLLYRGMCRW